MLAQHDPARYPVFFDSAAQGPLAQFSFLATAPVASLTRGAQGELRADGVPLVAGGFLDNLQAWLKRERQQGQRPDDLPFAGGWFVYLGYEMAEEVEPHLRLPPAPLPFSAFALRVKTLAIHDQVRDTVYVISEADDAGSHRSLVDAIRDVDVDESPIPAPRLKELREESPEKFLERVRHAKAHIAEGDIYQANLSRAWRLTLAEPDASHAQVYAALRQANPAPFAARATWQGVSVFSSSPERLLRIQGSDISTRPIAGTRARHAATEGGSDEQDRRDIAALVEHPKERAEHVMLIDLERNDLGRVCVAGSVIVDEYMVTESYAHVHHIVSNVRGRLREDATAVDALRALFPGGTITGCPKFRCMQIIAALENEGRGAYTGSLGWLGLDGDADFNILIRTLALQGSEIELRAGAGIVADSIPERELEETRAKARGLLRAFGAA